MPFPPRQNAFDWITQAGHIFLGRKVAHKDDQWLLGPIGGIEETAEEFIARIAREQQLQIVESDHSGSGLIDSMSEVGLSVSGKIEKFYHQTSDFELDVWTEWRPFFKPFGALVGMLFSKRIQQLYLPMSSLETSQGIKSEVIRLVDANGVTVYRIWRRRLRVNEGTIFYGIYSQCRLPSGQPCIKTIFPLPQGSATAIFEIQSDGAGNLELLSWGRTYGDPGFYVLIADGQGNLYKHYMPYFRQRIRVYEDGHGILRDDHTMNLWCFRVHKMHYKMTQKNVGNAS